MSFAGEVSAAPEPSTPFSEEQDLPPGIGPWALAWRRLRRNRGSLFFGGVFLLVVVLCLLGPVYAHSIAHTGPNTQNITATVKEGGKTVNVVSLQGIPIGPTWNIHHYFLGADELGRDVAVRLLYGGRASLEIGVVAMLMTVVIGVLLGLISGYFRGFVDGVISRINDVIWSYPAVLLGITIGTVLNVRGLGPFKSSTLMTTAVVIGFVYIPYVARPVRAQVIGLREREFIDAARQQGLSSMRIIFGELLPNLSSTILVFIPLMLANAILLEAALTYLGAGVQPPNASWGTMLQDGLQNDFPSAFHNILIPGLAIVITVMSVNIFGDGLRDALDPRSR